MSKDITYSNKEEAINKSLDKIKSKYKLKVYDPMRLPLKSDLEYEKLCNMREK